jgi:hypothetical protein
MINRGRKIVTYTLLFLFLGICIAARDTGNLVHTLFSHLGVFSHQLNVKVPKPGINVKP